MNSAERKAKLREFTNGNIKPVRTGIPINYHGQNISLSAYNIPLEYLVYNPYNGRIGSVVKSYERQYHSLDPENAEDKKIIEKFLFESKPDANKTTRQRLLKEHQQKHAIVTADGVIIDGNRRACLLNSLAQDPTIPELEKQHCHFLIAIILPEDATKKEILSLETLYQMGEDAKVDYNPIEKYLKCKDLQEAGFTEKDISKMMGCPQSEVRTMLETLVLMEQYLDEYDYSGIYTQLDKREDLFLKLNAALKKYRAGIPSMRTYDKETDVSDLKLIAFDYIRANFDQGLFREIISAPSARRTAASFFSQEKVWNDFRDQHFDFTDRIHADEQSVNDLIASKPDEDISRLLKARDLSWQRQVKSKFEENFKKGKDVLDNYNNATKPLQQLQKAYKALEVVDCSQPTFKTDAEIRSSIDDLDRLLSKFKAILSN